MPSLRAHTSAFATGASSTGRASASAVGGLTVEFESAPLAKYLNADPGPSWGSKQTFLQILINGSNGPAQVLAQISANGAVD